MAEIHGNLRYFSAYESIEELIRDKAVDSDRVVFLLQGKDLVMYSVKKTGTNESVKLDNGLFATKVFTTSAGEQFYSTKQPIKISVGGVEVGREFKETPITDVFDAIFFPRMGVSFDISLNIDSLVVLRGTKVFLTKVSVINIMADKIVKAALKFDNEVYKEEEINNQITSYDFLINKTILDNTTVSVTLYSEDNKGTVERIIRFDNPIFWAMVSEDYSPSSASVLRMNQTVDEGGFISVDVSTADTCIFVAVENGKKVTKILDESGHDILDNFEVGDVEMWLTEQSTVYTTYKSNRCTVDDYMVKVFVEVAE